VQGRDRFSFATFLFATRLGGRTDRNERLRLSGTDRDMLDKAIALGRAMPYANNQGICIHYEVEGAGPPLVLHHGTFGRGDSWKDFGYADVLKADRQLILLDARGHGASDKPHDPAAYDLRLRVGDVTAVLDDREIRRADYFGYSMGGWIGFGLAKHAPERLRSLIVGGAHPYAENMQAFRDLMSQEPKAFLALVEKVFSPYMTPAIRAGLLANDLKALLALTQDRASLADVLPTMSIPCLLFAGEADPRLPQVQACLKSLANGTFFSLPGCDHVSALARSDLVLPHVRTFFAKVL
jgi:pimeloyl-ACP methyl ester carboxylesterase